MYATTRIRVKGRTTKPAPVRKTVVLFDPGRRLKSPDFGRGILASRQSYRLPCTLADMDAVAGLFADSDRERAEARLAAEEDFDVRCDQAAFEDACLERYTRGFCL